jgi:hypothetical protein
VLDCFEAVGRKTKLGFFQENEQKNSCDVMKLHSEEKKKSCSAFFLL